MARSTGVGAGAERDRLVALGNERLTENQKAIVEDYLSRYPRPIKMLVHSHGGTYRRAVLLGMSNDDINQICCLGVIRGVRTWDPTKSSFDTYSVFKMWGEVSRWCKHFSRGTRFPSNPVIPLIEEIVQMHADEPLDVSQVGDFLSVLTERQRMAIDLRMGLTNGHTMTYEQVGIAMGVSKQRVQQIIENATVAFRRRMR